MNVHGLCQQISETRARIRLMLRPKRLLRATHLAVLACTVEYADDCAYTLVFETLENRVANYSDEHRTFGRTKYMAAKGMRW